jgi:DNA polymerase III subunit alpha, Gram-positive type
MNPSTINYLKQLYIIRVIINIIENASIHYQNFKHKFIQFSPNVVKDETIYYDFETTGLNPYHDKIIEYCFMIEDNTYNKFIESIVDPECKIEKKITDITGIHPDMFDNQKPIMFHISKIHNFISENINDSIFNVKKSYLIAHNNTVFDKIFLEKELNYYKKTNIDKDININLKNIYYIDSLLLARKLLPELRSHSLLSLSKHFKIKQGNHRAYGDVKCLRDIYINLLKIIAEQNNLLYTYYLENPELVYKYISY